MDFVKFFSWKLWWALGFLLMNFGIFGKLFLWRLWWAPGFLLMNFVNLFSWKLWWATGFVLMDFVKLLNVRKMWLAVGFFHGFCEALLMKVVMRSRFSFHGVCEALLVKVVWWFLFWVLLLKNSLSRHKGQIAVVLYYHTKLCCKLELHGCRIYTSMHFVYVLICRKILQWFLAAYGAGYS